MRFAFIPCPGSGRTSQSLYFSAVVALTALVLAAVVRPAAGAQVLWEYHPAAGYVDASPGVADLDGDRVLDLVCCTTAGNVVALDANGHLKWSAQLRQTVSVPPTLTRFSDGRVYVVVFSNVGTLHCLDGVTGRPLWDYTLPDGIDWGTTAVVATDLDGDGRQELIAGDRTGHLVSLDERGHVVWSQTLPGGINTAPAVSDVDGDGEPELILGTTRSALSWLSASGKILRVLKNSSPVGSSPQICDLNGDGRAEILVGEGKSLSCYDGTGRRFWRLATAKPIHDAVTVADLEQDGRPEVLAVDLQGNLVCVDGAGEVEWRASVQQRVRRSPSVADVDRDGEQEILVAGYSATLYVFRPDGELKESYPLRGTSNATPTVVDFRGDGKLAVVVPTTAGVYVLTWKPTGALSHPVVAWAEYRVNSARTGSLLGQAPPRRSRITGLDYGLLHVGTNLFVARVENPGRKKLTLELAVERPGENPLTTRVVSSDTSFVGEITYTVSSTAVENLTFRATLRQGKQLLASRVRRFYLVPFAKDVSDVTFLLQRARSQLQQIPDSTLVYQKLSFLSQQVRKLRERIGAASTMSPLERGELRSDLDKLYREARQLAAMVAEAAKHRSRLVAYAANPWAPFGAAEEIAEGRTPAPDLLVEAFEGETESAALNLANYGSRNVWVRVEPEDLVSEQDSVHVPWRQVLHLFEAVAVPTQVLDMVTDALPRVNQAQAILLPAWNVRQLWLNVRTATLKPGIWKTRVRVRSVDVSPAETWATLTIRVWPHSLPKKQPLRLCQWGYVHTSVLKDFPDEALRDQVEHGTNVFVATADFAPEAHFDAQGNLVGNLDFAAHDAYVRKHAPHGIILFFNYQTRLKGPAKPFSPVWTRAYKSWIHRWAEHLKAMGLDYSDFAFYPVDEPGLREGSVAAFIGYTKPIREVDPRLQIYVDPVKGATLEDLKRMAPNVDIWCPNRNSFLLKEGLDKLAFIKSTGKAVWTYECEGNAKHQSSLGYYRGQAWLVWYRGLTGIGFWSYCTSRFDPWFVPSGGSDYLLIYQGNGVVTSKRWEAVRDGVEDYSMLWKLRQTVREAQAKPSKKMAVREAQRFLDKQTYRVAQFCGLDPHGTQPTARGMAFQRQIEDTRWQTIRAMRRRLAQLLEMLH